jgi:hypothetical protein
MRRAALPLAATLAALILAAVPAQAAAPAVGPVSAVNIQGVSALLDGTVDPQGLPTTYQYEYSTQVSFAGASKTPLASAGSGADPRPARAAIDGLQPNTVYHFRLRASNGDGPVTGASASFKTTAGFGFRPGTEGFSAAAIADGGAPASQAGLHPYRLSFGVRLNQGAAFEDQSGATFPDGDLRDLTMELPPGFFLNGNAVGECTLSQFHTPRVSPYGPTLSGESCPDRTQVGTVELRTSLGGGLPRRFGLFNLEPPAGVAGQLGFAPFGSPIVLDVALRPGADGSYTLALEARNVPQTLDFHGLDLTLWGIPWGVSHDGERGNCLNEAEPAFPWAKCNVGEPATDPPQAYLTLPAACSGPLFFKATADSWQQPGSVTAEALNRNSGGQPVQMTCNGLVFSPKPVGQLNDTKASSPSGYNFRLTNDLEGLTDPTQFAAPSVKTAIVSLPAGVTVNPSVGAGLGACTPAQYAQETAFSNQGDGCPNAAKLGDFRVTTPVFDGLFSGAVYLAQSDDPATPAPGAENPFDSLVAVYLIARLPERGIIVKVNGKIEPNPATGDLTATFDGLPQFPYTDLDLTFRTGQRAFLITPPACGPATTTTDSSPWALALSPSHTTTSPFAPIRTTTSSQITTGIGGGPCPSGIPPFNPGVNAGGVNSNVNSYTPYFVHITRTDIEQEITSYSLELPEGITGKLAGIPFCSDAAIAAARTKRGLAEIASPSCPAASEIGHIQTGYGVGSALTYTNGRIYLAGPYNGQPLSIVAINPATVGPFDLGNVVIRSAFSVDEHTAQLNIDTGSSDRIPHILSGVVLHLRDVRIYMDRFQFTHNPSSCAPSQLVSTMAGSGARFDDPSDDSSATSTVHFQLLNCRTLGFKPKLGVRLRGGTKRRAFPELRVTFASRGQGDTNLKEISVAMPHSQFLAQQHIKGICTKAQFSAERCPADSIYGSAVAYTPLFDEPLRGNVYLRSSSGQLPDLVASIYSGAVKIVLEGHIGGTKQGGIRALFKNLPDQPVDKFVMTLFGGKRGLLQNSSDICAVPPLAQVKALGQTNLGAIFTSTLRGQCGGKKGKKSKRQGDRKRGRR